MLIGLCGLAGSGKSTIADTLVLSYGFRRHRFAGPLKDMLKAIGLTDAHVDGELKTLPCELLGNNSPRFAMQTLGTEWGRTFMGPNFWVNLARDRVRRDLESGHSVVLDDVRFQSEVDMVHELHGKVVRVERPGLKAGSHVSEALAFEPDVTIRNNHTLESLRIASGGLVADLRGY